MQPTPETLKAIETAIQIERDGLAFYNEAAQQTDDPNGKKMYLSLVRDEQTHLKLFEDARESLLAEGKWLSPEQVQAISPRRFERPPIFPTVEEIKAIDLPERQLAALQRGIRAEQEAITFYSEQRDKTDDPDAKAMYAYLVEQEEGHYTILQGEYDYMTQTGFWFGIREFDIESM